jgi:hypothetical protein
MQVVIGYDVNSYRSGFYEYGFYQKLCEKGRWFSYFQRKKKINPVL